MRGFLGENIYVSFGRPYKRWYVGLHSPSTMAPPVAGAQAQATLDPSLLFTGRWWQHSHILWLNILLLVPLVTSYANGFGKCHSVHFISVFLIFSADGSMMNGLQSVQQWKDYFGHPDSKDLGLFNAIQSIGCVPSHSRFFPISFRQ